LKGASIRKLTEEEKDNLEGEIGSFEAGEILKIKVSIGHLNLLIKKGRHYQESVYLHSVRR
jgi:hypothetical protein